MKKYLLVWSIILVGFVSCNGSKQKIFEAGAKEFTQQCPMMVDENTRADSAVYTKNDNTMRYYYALIGTLDNPQIADQIKASLDDSFATAIKATDELKIYRDGKVTIEYIYHSATTKDEFFRVIITPDMYK